MTRRRAVAGAVFAGWLGMALSPNALAQPAPGTGAASAGDAQVEQARQLYKDGVKEAARGKWDKARALFAEAFRLRAHFQIAFSLGQAELKLGDHLAAAEHLAFFLREAKDVGDEERRKAREMLDEAERQVVTLVISTNQRGAEVLVDGVSVGQAPLGREVFVAPGGHVIEARLEGFQTATDARTAVAGAYLQLGLTLSKVRPVAPEVRPAVPVAPPPPARPPLWPVVVSAGAAVVLLGSGVGLTLAANGKFNEAAKERDAYDPSYCYGMPTGKVLETCTELHGKWVATDNLSNAAVVTFVAGGVVALGAAGLGVWTWTRPDAKASARSVQIIPALTTGHRGVVAVGTW